MPYNLLNDSVHQQVCTKGKFTPPRCMNCERYSQHANFKHWQEKHKATDIAHVGLYPMGILKSKELKKRLANAAVNTVMTGPLKCDINCITSVRRRDTQGSGCRCGAKVSSRTCTKQNQTGDLLNHSLVNKACNNSVETITFGTQFENPPEIATKSLTTLESSNKYVCSISSPKSFERILNPSLLVMGTGKPNESVSVNCLNSRDLVHASNIGPIEHVMNINSGQWDAATGTKDLRDLATKNDLNVQIEEVDDYFKPKSTKANYAIQEAYGISYPLTANERVIEQNMKQNEIDSRTKSYNQGTETSVLYGNQGTITDMFLENYKNIKQIDTSYVSSESQSETPIGVILTNRLKYLVEQEQENIRDMVNTGTSCRPEIVYNCFYKRSETSIGITSEIRTQRWAVSRFPVRGPDF